MPSTSRAPSPEPRVPSTPATLDKSSSDYLRRAEQAQTTKATSIKAESERQRTESSRTQKAEQAFAAGKALYEGGNVEGALAEWEKMLPYLAADAPERRTMASLRTSLKKIQDAKKAAPAPAVSAPAVSAEERLATLRKAETRLADQLRASESARAQSSQAQDQQKALDEIYRKGRAAFDAGQTAQAVAEWQKLSAYLSAADPAKETLAKLKELDQKLSAPAPAPKPAEPARVSADMKTFLTTVRQKWEAEKAERDAARNEVELPAKEARQTIESAYQAGRMAYYNGEYEKALEEWKKLLPYVDPGSEDDRALRALTNVLAQLRAAEQAAKDAVARKTDRPRPPADLKAVMAEMRAKLDAGVQAKQTEKKAAEQVVLDRQTRLEETFKKGRAYYDQGLYREALTEWKSILPELEDQQILSPMIAQAESAQAALAAAEKAAQEAASRQSTKFKSPATFSQLLTDTQAKLKQKTDEATQKKNTADTSLTQRQTRLEETFKKGRAYYDQGLYREALTEWKSILPELEDQQILSPMIAQAESAQAALESLQRDAQTAEARSRQQLAAPQGLSQLLQEAQTKIRAAQTETAALQQKADARSAAKEEKVRSIYAKGETLYRQGQVTEALAEWKQLLTDLQGADTVRAEIERVDKLNTDLLAAQKAVADTAKRLPMPPSGLQETLLEVEKSLQIRKTQAEQQRLSADTDFKARQEAASATYQQGRNLYLQGKFKEAIAAWKTLLPLVDDAKTLRSLIEGAEDSYVRMLEAENAAADAQRLRPESPKDLQDLLNEAIRKAKEDTLKAESDLARTRKSLAERQAVIAATVQEGMQLYNQGRVDDAIEVWKRLSGDVDATSPIMAQLDALKHNYKAYTDADVAYKAVRSVDKISDFPGADKMTDFVEEANTRLRDNIEDLRGKTSQSQKVIEEREAWMSATARNGIAFYEKGRIADALEQWDRLIPYLQEDALLTRRIEELRDSYEQMAAAEESLESAEVDQKNYEFPESRELSEYLEDAKTKMESRVEETRERTYETEQSASDRKQWFNDVYQKGKAYYEEGRYAEAVREWEALAPHMSGPIQSLIQQARQKAREAGQTGPASLPASVPVSHRGEVEEEAVADEPAPAPVRRPAATVASAQSAFVTGAVVSADSGTVTLRLYSGKPDDRLTVKHDGSTRIEGSDKKPSEFSPGTVVDLRYDPKSNRADSIQVY